MMIDLLTRYFVNVNICDSFVRSLPSLNQPTDTSQLNLTELHSITDRIAQLESIIRNVARRGRRSKSVGISGGK